MMEVLNFLALVGGFGAAIWRTGVWFTRLTDKLEEHGKIHRKLFAVVRRHEQRLDSLEGGNKV